MLPWALTQPRKAYESQVGVGMGDLSTVWKSRSGKVQTRPKKFRPRSGLNLDLVWSGLGPGNRRRKSSDQTVGLV